MLGIAGMPLLEAPESDGETEYEDEIDDGDELNA